MGALAQVVLLIIAASCAVALVTLARAPRRAPALLLLLAAILGAALFASYRQPTPAWLFHAVCAAFGVFVVLPGLLYGGVRAALRGRRFRLALAIARWRRLLLLGAGGRQELEILAGLALVHEGRTDEALEVAQQRLAGLAEGPLRIAAFEQLLTVQLHARRFAEAVQLIEAEGGVPLAAAGPTIAGAMVRAYAETGELDRAGRALALLEQTPAALAPAFAPTVNGARLAFVAHLGLEPQLQRILAAAPAFAPGSDAAFALLWRGVAAARAGRPAAAEALWREAAASSRDPQLVRVAEQRCLAGLPPAPAASEELLAVAEQATLRAAAYEQVPHSGGRFWRRAPATAALLLVIIAVHALAELLGDLDDPWLLLQLGANFRAAVVAGEIWRLLTSVLLHGGLLHVALNAYALYLLGRLAEQMFGTLRFLIIFWAAGLAGAAASAALGSPQHLSVGASGAVFGLIGACLVGLRALRGRVPEQWRKQLTYNLLVIVGLNLYIGFTVAVIDNAAHIGGFVGGLLASWLLRPAAGSPAPGHRRALIVAAALITAAVVASGLLLALRGPQSLLARLPRQTVRVGSLEVRCPAHWTRVAGRRGLALVDPLLGLLEPPTLEVQRPASALPGVPLAERARAGAEARRAMWQASPQVRAVRLARPRRVAGAISIALELDVDGGPMTDLALYKSQGELILVAHVAMPTRHVARYSDVIAEIARTLRFAP